MPATTVVTMAGHRDDPGFADVIAEVADKRG
jgi:hypothetical protein